MEESDHNTLSNRQKSREPKGGAFWCHGCDGFLVWAQQKCPNCGKRSGKKRSKPKA